MNRKVLLTSLAAALAGAMGLAGCGSSGTNGTVKSCATDGDCTPEKEVCLPGAKICVPTCEADSDCTSKYCKPVDGISSMVCGCTSGSDCGTDTCHTVDGVCEPKCTVDSECADYSPTRTCNVSLGQCNVGGCNPACTGGKVCAGGVCVNPAECTVGQTDCPAGLPACVSGSCSACTSDSQCAGRGDGNTRCDTSTGGCVTPLASCDSQDLRVNLQSGGPSTCNYGEACLSNVCRAIARTPTCAGFTNYPFEWDPTARGPVIVSAQVTSRSAADSTHCGDGGPSFGVSVTFYAPGGWHHGSGFTAVASHDILMIRQDGVIVGGRTAASVGYYADLPASGVDHGTFTVWACGTSNPTDRAMFLHDSQTDTDGNIICLQ